MNKVLTRIKKVFLEILPAFLFFFVMFHILSVSRALILKQHGIVAPASAIATVGALIIAKVVLVADRIPFLNLYPRKPLIYNVVLKTIVFSIFTGIFFVLEELIRTAIKQGAFSGAWAHLCVEYNWEAFWMRQLWVSILILFYCATVALVRTLGPARVKDIFLGKKYKV